MTSRSCRTPTQLIFLMLPSDVCVIILLVFVHANCIGVLSLPLLRCWWHLFVLCELHHTFSFSWATHCMTPSDTLHLISPPRSSSFNLSSAVWEPLVPFPFVSSLGHFAGDASTAGFSPSSAENFDPLDPANYYLLSTIWFLIKWIIFLATQEIHVSVKALSFIHYDPQHIFHTLWSFFCKQKPPWGMLMNTVSPPGWREALGLKNSTGLSSMDFQLNVFKRGVLHTGLNQPWMQFSGGPGLLDPHSALFLPISY